MFGSQGRRQGGVPQLDIDLDLNDRRVDLVSEGNNLALRIRNLPDSSLIARTLAPCRHVVCASPTYLAARGVPVTPADFAAQHHDCLVYSNRPTSEQWRFRVDDEWKEVPIVARRLGANNGEVLCDAAVAGLGLVALPTFIVSDALQRGDLQPVLPGFALDEPGIHAVWPPNRQLSAKVRASSISSRNALAAHRTGTGRSSTSVRSADGPPRS